MSYGLYDPKIKEVYSNLQIMRNLSVSGWLKVPNSMCMYALNILIEITYMCQYASGIVYNKLLL